jgi:hypothetical protein
MSGSRQFESFAGHVQSSGSGGYDAEITLLDRVPEEDALAVRFRIVGEVHRKRVDGTLSLFLSEDLVDGWDWQGSPDLRNADDLLDQIMGFFDGIDE